MCIIQLFTAPRRPSLVRITLVNTVYFDWMVSIFLYSNFVIRDKLKNILRKKIGNKYFFSCVFLNCFLKALLPNIFLERSTSKILHLS